MCNCHEYKWKNAYIEDLIAWGISICLFRWRLGCINTCVCIGAHFFHIFGFFSRTTWCILMKLGRDEVLMVPYKCCCFSAKSGQRWIQGGAKIGHIGSHSSKNIFRPEGYSNKPNSLQWSRSMWEEVLLILVPLRSQIFDAILTFFRTLSFGLILTHSQPLLQNYSMDFDETW